ncbi:hypothetical protein [Thermovibrio sp.]
MAEEEKLVLKTNGFLVKEVVTQKEKKEEIVPLPKEVYPGDVIEYRIKASNVSNEDLKNVVIRAKIPEGTTYVSNSASGTPEFSIDKGKTFSKEPVKYTVFVNGKKVIKVATPDMYTNIRWKIPVLKPGEDRVFKYRVQVKPIRAK